MLLGSTHTYNTRTVLEVIKWREKTRERLEHRIPAMQCYGVPSVGYKSGAKLLSSQSKKHAPITIRVTEKKKLFRSRVFLDCEN